MYKHQTLIVSLNLTKIINLFIKSDWLITMLFQGQQRCWSRNMSHLVKAGSAGYLEVMCAIPAPLVSPNRTAQIMTVFKQVSRTRLFPLPLVSQIDPHVISWANVVFLSSLLGCSNDFQFVLLEIDTDTTWEYSCTILLLWLHLQANIFFLCTQLTNLLRFNIFRDLLIFQSIPYKK